MQRLDVLGLVIRIAWRNLLASRRKSTIMGSLVALGACLMVSGRSVLEAMDRAISRCVTDSLIGDIQVYSSRSRDALEIIGNWGETADLEPLSDFAALSAALGSVEGVAAVVPMGIGEALAYSGQSIDQALSDLRTVSTARREGDSSPALARKYAAQKGRVRHVLSVLGDQARASKVSDALEASGGDIGALAWATSAAFWEAFDADPYAHLEFLENHVAPLTGDADLLYLPYLGTDPDLFARTFKRLRIVDGQPIPAGQRGFLFSKQMYEEQVKLKAARGFDRLLRALQERRRTIAGDLELQRLVRANAGSVGELLLQLDPEQAQRVLQALQRFFRSEERDASRLLTRFFRVDDSNVLERYRYYQRELVPHLVLYRLRVGDSLLIQSAAHGGYVRSANLKIYGTFEFDGLERSPQAGLRSMMDLVSFRELSGFLTAAGAHEIEALHAKASITEVAQADVESQLFGESARAERQRVLASAPGKDAEQPAPAQTLSMRSRVRKKSQRYDPQELQQGEFLHAAVRLREGASLEQTLRAIEAAGRRAGLPLKAVPWQAAAGVFGQFVVLAKAVLYVALFIIFAIALLIVNSALVIATLERVAEIGTLRAIGAQRGFILAVLLAESLAVGALAGVCGAAVGAALMLLLGRVGLAASNDAMQFVFSGPRLYPILELSHLVQAVLVVQLLSMLAALYPTWLALRISPREAMSAQ